MGRIKFKNGVKWICNECGFTSESLDRNSCPCGELLKRKMNK